MRSKIIASLTVSLLLFSLNNAQFATSAAAKAGGVCLKENKTTLIKSVKYKCTKSGSKLIWKKSQQHMAAPSKSATPATSAKPSETPSQAEGTGGSVAALTTPEYLPKPPEGGNDEYRCFLLDPKFTEDTYLESVSIIPGNLKVSHHGILYRLSKSSVAATQKLDQESQTPGWPGERPASPAVRWARSRKTLAPTPPPAWPRPPSSRPRPGKPRSR